MYSPSRSPLPPPSPPDPSGSSQCTRPEHLSQLLNLSSMWGKPFHHFPPRFPHLKYEDNNSYSQFSSVAQSCLTLCDPMNCSTPGFPVHHQFLELTQTHVHQVSDAIQPSHPLSSPSPPASNLSQHQGLSQQVRSFAPGGPSIGVSASASVLPMSVLDWFPLGLTTPSTTLGLATPTGGSLWGLEERVFIKHAILKNSIYSINCS